MVLPTRGLSPLVRGKRWWRCLPWHVLGSIPACAGETDVHRRSLNRRWVYPRLCGGNGIAERQRMQAMGLSPLVRGKPLQQAKFAGARGSIPACAGETCRNQKVPHRIGVYPRLCGGNNVILQLPVIVQGLSPLVRGKRRRFVIDDGGPGSIPACAGETASRGRRS